MSSNFLLSQPSKFTMIYKLNKLKQTVLKGEPISVSVTVNRVKIPKSSYLQSVIIFREQTMITLGTHTLSHQNQEFSSSQQHNVPLPKEVTSGLLRCAGIECTNQDEPVISLQEPISTIPGLKQLTKQKTERSERIQNKGFNTPSHKINMAKRLYITLWQWQLLTPFLYLIVN